MSKTCGTCCFPFCDEQLVYDTGDASHPIYCRKHKQEIRRRYLSEFPHATHKDLFWLVNRKNTPVVVKSDVQVKLP